MDQFVQENSEWPDVEGVIMILVLDHLGSHVFKCATEGVSLLHMVWLNTPSEVANLDDVTLLYQNVLRLDVSVDKPLLVHVVNARTHLNEEVEGSILAQELLLSDQVEQVALAGILQGQVNRIFVLKTGIQTADVLVIELFLNSYFSYQCFFYFIWRQTRFFYFLHCNLNAGGSVNGELNFSVTALAEVGFLGLDELDVV